VATPLVNAKRIVLTGTNMKSEASGHRHRASRRPESGGASWRLAPVPRRSGAASGLWKARYWLVAIARAEQSSL